jgi:hypothetical protein
MSTTHPSQRLASCRRNASDSDEEREPKQECAESDGLLLTPSVIVLFLLPEAISAIEDSLVNLLRLISNLRIVCNTLGLQALRPDEIQEVLESNGARTTLYLYSADSLRAGILNG